MQVITGFTLARFRTPHSLRQHGTSHFICFRFFALRAEKRKKKK
jgi:hypothetical protein